MNTSNRALLSMIRKALLPYYFGCQLKQMFERRFELLLCVPKGFNASQALKRFSFLLMVTRVIFALAINTDSKKLMKNSKKCR